MELAAKRKRDRKRKSKELRKSTNKSRSMWTEEEESKYREGLMKFGKNWVKIASLLKTKDRKQVLGHGKEVLKKLKGKQKLNKGE